MVEVNGRSAKPFAHAGRRDDRWRMMVSAEEMH